MVLTPAGAAYELPAAGTRSVIAFAPDEQTFSALPRPADGATVTSLPPDVMFERALPPASAQALGIDGRPDDFSVASLRVGGVVLATATSLDNVADTIDTTRTLLWVIGPALVALVAGLAWLLAGRALRPVHAVTSRVASIGSRSLHERVPVPGSRRRDRRAGDDDERHARPAGDGVDVEPAAGVRRVPRAAHAGRRDAHRAGGRPPSTPANDWDGDVGACCSASSTGLQGLVDDLLLLARGDERGVRPHAVLDRRRRP